MTTIYGLGILAGCFIMGQLIGLGLGSLLGIEANVGGVGFAMLFLILIGDWLKQKNIFQISTNTGIEFWNAMYIPIIVAMSATQDVKGALSSGYIAILVGIIPTGAMILLIPFLTKMARKKSIKL